MLVAFSWQSFLTQTHRHYGNETASAAATGGNPQQHDRKAPSRSSDNCPLCREVAHAGQFVLPQAIDLEAPAAADFWLVTPPSAGRALAQRSHAWQSRAPPSSLQA